MSLANTWVDVKSACQTFLDVARPMIESGQAQQNKTLEGRGLPSIVEECAELATRSLTGVCTRLKDSLQASYTEVRKLMPVDLDDWLIANPNESRILAELVNSGLINDVSEVRPIELHSHLFDLLQVVFQPSVQ